MGECGWFDWVWVGFCYIDVCFSDVDIGELHLVCAYPSQINLLKMERNLYEYIAMSAWV